MRGYTSLVQEHYFLVPPAGTRFVDLTEARLRRVPGAFGHPDPAEGKTFVIAASPQMGKWLEAKLRQEPRTSLISQGLITIHPAAIEVWQNAPRETLAVIEPFVTWILRTWPCRVIGEDGDDWTARYGQDPHALFVEEDTWG